MVKSVALAAPRSGGRRAALTDWRLERPRQWMMQVNRPQSTAAFDVIRTSVQRGRPFGSEAAGSNRQELGLEYRVYPREGQGRTFNWTYPLPQ